MGRFEGCLEILELSWRGFRGRASRCQAAVSPRQGVSKKGALCRTGGNEGPPWAILRLSSASLGSSASSHLPHQGAAKSTRSGKPFLCSRCEMKDRDAPELRVQENRQRQDAGCLESTGGRVIAHSTMRLRPSHGDKEERTRPSKVGALSRVPMSHQPQNPETGRQGEAA